MSNPKTEKAWAFLTASVRLCADAHRMLTEDDRTPQAELKALESSIADLLKAKSMVGRRIHG